METPGTPEWNAIAESQRQRAERVQALETRSAIMDSERETYNNARADYYQSLKEKHNDFTNLGWNFRDEDYVFIDAVRPIIDTADDPQFMKERIAAAGMYSNIFQIPIGTAFLNLENLHKEYIGQNFVKKTGIKAVADSLVLNIVNADYNRLAQQLAGNPNDRILQRAVEEKEREIVSIHAPVRGCDIKVCLDQIGEILVSIHAPVRGCDATK